MLVSARLFEPVERLCAALGVARVTKLTPMRTQPIAQRALLLRHARICFTLLNGKLAKRLERSGLGDRARLNDGLLELFPEVSIEARHS